MLKLNVTASKNYDVTITSGLDAFEKLNVFLKGEKVAVITDDVVDSLYSNVLDKYLTSKKVFKYVMPHGEQNKNAENYLKIINYLAQNGFTRKDSVITFGGGVVGDIGAFVASTYMRGINLIAVPTTLLSMVDSSVGGKTAIDLPSGKNLCGTFYQPNAVYINVDFLKTLPKREIDSGMGEVVKYAFLDTLVSKELISKGLTKDLIYNCLKIKADVVCKDEKESGLRMILNLGHTVGHAIETLSNYQISHGECVAKGIYYAIMVSSKIYNFSQQKTNELINLLQSYPFDLSLKFSPNQLDNQIKMDKKSEGDSVNFVVIESIGNTTTKKLTFDELLGLL